MSTYRVRLIGNEPVADGTRAFHFEKPEGFTFKAGQALDLVLPARAVNAAQPARHTFSIVSAPHENCLTIATRMRDSQYKQALASLTVGADVELDGPFGSLTLHKDPARPAVFVAGGIGITPFISILRQATREPLTRSLVLLYSNHRPEDAGFLAELQALDEQTANFELIATMTKIDASTQEWSGRRGQIDADLLARTVAPQASPIYYLAGPPGFVEAMQELLNGIGIDDDDIRSEGFYGY